MEVVILAGGLGTRLSEYTDKIPKPMVPIGGRPILWHIMQRYAQYGHKRFIIALGYKGDLIKEYFLRFSQLTSNFTVDLKDGTVDLLSESTADWKVTLVDTGEDTATGGRLRKIRDYVSEDRFMLTYGDGVSNIKIDELVKFHDSCRSLATVTAVRPPTRFGEISLSGDMVTRFAEKPQIDRGWISGGYFVLNKDVVSLIDGDETMFEREPLEHLSKTSQLNAFRHEGFWQCMDTKRDLEYLRELEKDNAPWVAERP